MTWYLNPFLTSYRAAVDKKYPNRTKGTDGTKGNAAHAASVSEHNPDPDGSVDAWDMDVNLLGSSNDTGSPEEDAEVKKVIAEFLAQPQAQLVIYQEHIHNNDIDRPGAWRWYGNWSSGKNPHDHHAHLQSRQSKENQPYKGTQSGTDVVVSAPFRMRPWSGPILSANNNYNSAVIVDWQRGMGMAGWLDPKYIDGYFGPGSSALLRRYQAQHGLEVDGRLGPASYGNLRDWVNARG